MSKETIGVVGTVVSLLGSIGNEITTPVIGAPVTVIVAAFIGSVLSFFFGEPAKSSRELFTMSVAGTIIGSVVAAILPHVGFDWVSKVQAPIAIIAALGTRHLLPTIIERCKDLIKSFNPFNFFKKKEDK